MPALPRICLRFLLTATASLGIGCANREYVTPNVLLEVQASDPDFKKLRVYPNQTFITVYSRAIGQETGVSGAAGTVEAGFKGKRVEVPVKRKLPGAILGLEELDGQPLLWVTFDERCTETECAYGFVQTNDGLFRLFHVPELEGYADPGVYRKRIAKRKEMERTKIYSKSNATSVYFTLRGFAASIALEVKKRSNVDIETVVAPKEGVRPRGH